MMEYVRLQVDWNWDLLKAYKQLREFLEKQDDLIEFVLKQEKDGEKNTWFECFLKFKNDMAWRSFMVDFWNASIQQTCNFGAGDFESMSPKEIDRFEKK